MNLDYSTFGQQSPISAPLSPLSVLALYLSPHSPLPQSSHAHVKCSHLRRPLTQQQCKQGVTQGTKAGARPITYQP